MHCQGKRWKWNKPPGTVLMQFVPLRLLSQPKHTLHTDVLDISVLGFVLEQLSQQLVLRIDYSYLF